jgi:hypothetical protein
MSTDDGQFDAISRMTAEAYSHKMANREADRMMAAQSWRPPTALEFPGTLADSMLRPRPPVRYLVDGLWGVRHNISIEGIYKAGKTSVLGSLAGSLADGRPFLGFAAVSQPAGRIGIWNCEMDADDFDDYMTVETSQPDRIAVAHLRAAPMPFMVSQPARDAAVGWLRYYGVQVWILDTWSRLCAWNGIDPMDNSGVARLTAAVDEIKYDAGVQALAVTSHMPHSAKTEITDERAFGAQAFSGWVDGMWRYVKSPEGLRFLSADGRNIRLAECQVLQGGDGRLFAQAGDRRTASRQVDEYTVLTYVRDNPGATTNSIRTALAKRPETMAAILQGLEKAGLVYSAPGPRNAINWHPKS